MSVQPNLPATFKKLVLHRLSNDFKKSTRVEIGKTQELVDLLKVNPSWIVLRNLYAGVNASDVAYSNGRYNPGRKPPYECGLEGIGEVVAIGAQVADLKLGDVVAATGNTGGWYSEFRVLPARIAQKIPGNIRDPRYLALRISGLTSSFALEKTSRMKILAGSILSKYVDPALVGSPADKKPLNVLVTAAAGGAGMFAVQLAKLAGHRVAGTISSPEKAAVLKSMGVDVPVNYKTDDVRKVFKREFPKGFDIVYESVGGDLLQAALENLAIGGHIVLIGSISDYLATEQKDGTNRPDEFGGIKPSMLSAKSASLGYFYLPHFTSEYRIHLERLTRLMNDGHLKVPVDNGPNLQGVDNVQKAVDFLHSGKSIGKVYIPIAKL
ncbi:NAD(P)-binding protein [Gonapodya prolifera JEL478]|uniref:NAD(P)-binding protein n=1 Tax=Gonapodya prolifera (strain JEL478) TaxID=1344416 RepID=A0A139A808_GONPJ|nr:NAD(P)-binding protein [Gonapodya prolifera JEL478]|eukprot:KXS12818.1 NAD(P)-binding protein [Gonapodya prolifera JEL478]